MPQDKRIALAALAVTAIVGVGAPFATVLATNAHDDHRFRAEQVQSDRAELRSVLDEAAAALDLLDGQLTVAVADQEGELGREPHSPLRLPRQSVNRLQRRLDAAVRRYNSVAIRLGRAALATGLMDNALRTAGDLVSSLRLRVQPPVTSGGYSGLVRLYHRLSARFVDAANAIARSATS